MTRIWTAGLLAALGAAACSKAADSQETDTQPVVAIVPSRTTGIAPLDVEFSAVVQGGNPPLTYRWDFGPNFAPRDGETVDHVFETDGETTVELVVTDADGDEARNLVVIAVTKDQAPSVVLHTDDRRGVAPFDVFFETEASGNGLLTYQWDFGDGATGEGTSIAEHVYETPGSYTAKVKVVDEDGDEVEATQGILVEENSTPEVTVNATPQTASAPVDVTFDCTATGGNGVLRYSWDFGDSESSPLPSTLHTYTEQRTFRATCTVTDQDGDTSSAFVDIDTNDHAPMPLAKITAGACAIPESDLGSTRVELDATGSSDPEGKPLTYEWTFVQIPFGSGARFNNPTVAKPSFTPDLNGNYLLRLFVSDGVSRVGSDELQVVVSDDPARVSVLGGAGQQREVSQALPQPLLVRVENGCGLGIPGASVNWGSFGGQTSAVSSTTDRNGLATVGARLGSRAGTTTFVATSGTASARIEATANPGAGMLVMVDSVAPTTASATVGATVNFRINDIYYNFAPGTEATFEAELADPTGPVRASFDAAGSGTLRKTLTTHNGVATATVFSTVASTAYVVVHPPNGMSAMARQRVFSDDFENPLAGWSLRGDTADWEQGVPTFAEGPQAAHQGVGVLGTRLSELHSMGTFLSPSVAARTLSIDNPFGTLGTWLYVWQWVDTDISTGCAAGAGHVRWADQIVEPEGGYPGPLACDAVRDGLDPQVRSVSGSSGGWVHSEYMLGPRSGELAFEFRGSDSGKPRAGWYLDEVEVVTYSPAGPVTFTAAP